MRKLPKGAKMTGVIIESQGHWNYEKPKVFETAQMKEGRTEEK